jgi:hypothetical protein
MRRLQVYVATASNPIEEAERHMQSVRALGHEITFDWTVPVRQAGTGSPDDPAVRSSAALTDLRGVERSEVFWLIQPENTSTGAWVELGHALAFKKVRAMLGVRRPIVVVSGPSRRCIFADQAEGLADYRFESHAEALSFIDSLSRE